MGECFNEWSRESHKSLLPNFYFYNAVESIGFYLCKLLTHWIRTFMIEKLPQFSHLRHPLEHSPMRTAAFFHFQVMLILVWMSSKMLNTVNKRLIQRDCIFYFTHVLFNQVHLKSTTTRRCETSTVEVTCFLDFHRLKNVSLQLFAIGPNAIQYEK